MLAFAFDSVRETETEKSFSQCPNNYFSNTKSNEHLNLSNCLYGFGSRMQFRS